MGSKLSSPMISGFITREIKASQQVILETITDLNAPTFISSMVSYELVQGQVKPPKVGTVVREEKILDGQRCVYYKTITHIGENPLSITADIHASLEGARIGKDDARMGSWTILPSHNDETCQFVWTFAVAPKGIYSYLVTICCGKRTVAKKKRYFTVELEEYAAEAERRQRALDHEA